MNPNTSFSPIRMTCGSPSVALMTPNPDEGIAPLGDAKFGALRELKSQVEAGTPPAHSTRMTLHPRKRYAGSERLLCATTKRLSFPTQT